MDPWSWFDWVVEQFSAVINSLSMAINDLNPINIWNVMYTEFSARVNAMLPDPADLTEVWVGFLTFYAYLRPVYMLADNFVNIPVFAGAVAFCLTIEAVLFIPRIWRFILKMIPGMG